MEDFTIAEWLTIGFCVLLRGMSKGGFPVAGVAMPLMILLWPDPGQAARASVSFILPLLCAMDLIGIFLYRGKPDWSHIKKLMPATILGVGVASIFFVSDQGISVSDRTLKLLIGILGLTFTGWQIVGKRIMKLQMQNAEAKGWRPSVYGFSAAVTSTIAHAAGPVMQMYMLPTGMAKTQFAATTIYYFLFLNAIKLLPFALLGRFNETQLIMNMWMLPLIPAGVLLGYGIVKIMKEQHYILFIRVTLVLTSTLLVYRAISGT
jgi:hypothetical protein